MGIVTLPENVTQILLDVADERIRQEELKRKGKFKWTCADNSYNIDDINHGVRITHADKLAVLAEEFGEISKEVVEGLIDPTRLKVQSLRKELIQVAAVCVAWCESLEKAAK